jgi:hypothetical protein
MAHYAAAETFFDEPSRSIVEYGAGSLKFHTVNRNGETLD